MWDRQVPTKTSFLSRQVVTRLSVLAITGVAVAGLGMTEAAGESAYTATASARLLGVDVAPSPALLTDGALFDGGEAVAQARLDSLGVSRAFAANTFPSSTVMALNGTLSIALCGQPPPAPPCGTVPTEKLPTYPLSASSSYPLHPDDAQGGGPYQVRASSSRTASSGSATDGATAATATTTLDTDSGDVLSRADSTIAGLMLGDSVALSGVRATAEVSRAPSGRLEKKSSFAVSSMTILGQQVAVTPQGLTLPGHQLPLPDAGSGLKPVLAALRAKGIVVEPFPEQVLANGIVSAGLRITVTADVPRVPDPPPGVPKPGVGLTRLTAVLTLGGSSVSVTNTALPSFGLGGVPPLPGGLGPTSVAGDLGEQISQAQSPAGFGQGPEVPSSPDLAAAPGPVPARWMSAIPADVSTASFYPVLVLSGALLYGVARLFGFLGRKTA